MGKLVTVVVSLLALVGLLSVGCAPAAAPAQPQAAAPGGQQAAPPAGKPAEPAAPAQSAGAKKQLSMATATTGGTWYYIGTGAAQVINKYVPTVDVTAEVTSGTFENANLISTGKSDIGLVTLEVAQWAYKGEDKFQGKPLSNLRLLLAAHPNVAMVVALKSTESTTVEGLKGKRGSFGATGSSVPVTLSELLKLYGLDAQKDLKLQFLGFDKIASALKDGQLDFGAFSGGIPMGSLTDLALSRELNFLYFDPGKLKQFRDSFPYYGTVTVPAKTYRGQDKDYPSPTTGTFLLTTDKLPDDLAYQITKAILEHNQELVQVHPDGKWWTPEHLFSATADVPFHSGAVKYFREKGVWDKRPSNVKG